MNEWQPNDQFSTNRSQTNHSEAKYVYEAPLLLWKWASDGGVNKKQCLGIQTKLVAIWCQ